MHGARWIDLLSSFESEVSEVEESEDVIHWSIQICKVVMRRRLNETS